ncbi:MAG: amino acid adenylation domain-containing protein [Burkholderiaceae bacterium]|jgi:amino acid adenylation domain-containing protein|nr:amino acid adenylation domain-containing protein [Burkholderiaceae bacterium]
MKYGEGIWGSLSEIQRSLWFQYRIQPEISGYYNISFCVRILGELDAIRLCQALNLLATRHPILRVRFQEVDGAPKQCVDPNATVEVSVFDVEHLSDEQLKQRLAEDTVKPFDLAKAPLLRAEIYRRPGRQCILLLVFDHLICDGWSFWRLIDQLGELLESEPSAAALEAAASPGMDYFSYVQEQQEWLDSKAAERQLNYWRAALAGTENAAVLDLPTDRPRSQALTIGSGRIPIILSEKLTDGLRQLAKKQGVTIYVLLISAYFMLFHRLTGQDSIAIGSPMPARSNGRWSDVMGTFINTVVLCATFRPALTIKDLIRQVRSVAFQALRNQDYPFNQLVDRLNPPRIPGRTPYFQNLFVFHNARGANDVLSLMIDGVGGRQSASVRWGGLETTYWREPLEADAGLDLTLKISEFGKEITGGFFYAPTLFERETVERWGGYWVRLLEAMVADESQVVARIDLLDEAERRLLVEEWNAIQADYRQDKCIHELFEAQAERTPQATAVVYEERALSYVELNARANRLAHYLRKHGVGPDARVAVCVERSVEMVVGLLAVLKAGGGYVPLDPSYPEDRLDYMLTDSAPVVVLSDAAGQRALAGQTGGTPVIDIGDEAPWAKEPKSNPDRGVIGLTPQHLAYVIYTSGSTGMPKGMMIAHANVSRLFAATDAWFGFQASDVWTLFHSYAFDFSVWELWGALFHGGRLVVVPQATARHPKEFYQLLCRTGVTVLNQTPSAFRHLMAVQAESFEQHTLRYVIFGGEALETEILQPWYERQSNRATQLINMYGITETTVVATSGRIEAGDAIVHIGRPIANTQIYILDAYGAPVPLGVAGELYIGGAGVSRGYLKRADLTAERFVADPFAREPGTRMYRTGDLGRWLADGTIEFVGRNDFQVKIRGFRIELGEIEARLNEQAGVREAVVVARQDSGGDQRLVAYYTGEVIGAEELRGQLAASLPQYMVPAAYVHLEALPLTPNGKLDRDALPAPDGDAYASRSYEPPQGEVEEQLAAIWSELLKIERVGRYDNFFELGGHSLLAVQLVSQLRQALNVELSLSHIFAHPTLQALAQECLSSSRWPGAISLRAAGDDLPLFLVHEVSGDVLSWGTQLTRHLDTNIPVYGLAAESPAALTRQTIEGMADRLVQAIRSIQPSGPYRIAGWSFGGTLAYEIATQLIGNGEEVQFLGLLDTRYRAVVPESFLQDGALLKDLVLQQNPLPATVKALNAVDPADLDAMWRKCQELSLVPEDMGSLSMADMRLYFSRVRMHTRASNAYQAHPINIQVHLFIAQDDPTGEPPLSWDKILPAERISLIFVPGDHHSMLEEPNVAMLGAQFSHCIGGKTQAISLERTDSLVS